MKDLRSLSLPNMKPSAGQSPYILTPGSEKVEHGSLGRRESVDLLVSRVTVVSPDGGHALCKAAVITHETLRLVSRPVTRTALPHPSFVFHNFTPLPLVP